MIVATAGACTGRTFVGKRKVDQNSLVVDKHNILGRNVQTNEKHLFHMHAKNIFHLDVSPKNIVFVQNCSKVDILEVSILSLRKMKRGRDSFRFRSVRIKKRDYIPTVIELQS